MKEPILVAKIRPLVDFGERTPSLV